jgi:uncharacterized repeat protein (TIGR01451 family)
VQHFYAHRLKQLAGKRLPTKLIAATLGLSIVAGLTSNASAQQSPGSNSVPGTTIDNAASFTYSDPTLQTPYSGTTRTLRLNGGRLIDPLGQIRGCDGSLLDDYNGFTVGLYEPDRSGIELGNLVALSRTEFPDLPGNNISRGIEPNIENSNPFSLTNADEGRYNFLVDPTRALQSVINSGLRQADSGAQYILVVTPPINSEFNERRIRIEILSNTVDPVSGRDILTYRATALDGQPIAEGGSDQFTDAVEIENAELQGLNLFFLSLNASFCDGSQISIAKSADRAAAQPGDTVVYRLAVRNLANVALSNVVATDRLPPGFQLLPDSVMGQIGDQAVAIRAEIMGSDVFFTALTPLPADQVLNIIYATRVSPDALRGVGENTAFARGERSDNGFRVQAGPSIHRLQVDPGLLSDCATLIGRVFVDKNFDGEQQLGEAGIPNAVVLLDDGNRIVTDADGLYSVACMLPGHRSGVLDLSSLPGYTLSPNLYFSERNSQSRLVNIAPGGMVRMNFGVTPTFGEEVGNE